MRIPLETKEKKKNEDEEEVDTQSEKGKKWVRVQH